MQKIFLASLLLVHFLQLSAQKTTPTTQAFTVEGLVEQPLTIQMADLKNYATVSIDSVVIKNHLGERKSTLKNIKAVPLKSVLRDLKIKAEQPRQLSEFYFVCIAADGYKVVFSWNEVFNNPLGDTISIIVEVNGKQIQELDNRIAIFSPTDEMTGRRYVKSLEKIVVRRVE